MRQVDAFIGGEADAWMERNKDKVTAEGDPVLETMEMLGFKAKRVLEVGCANGWRLKEIQKRYGCEVTGADLNLKKHEKFIYTAGAHDLWGLHDFDVVIYGFCLYLCDRHHLFKIASEGDRVLADFGHIIIYDFDARYPYRVPYKHKEGLFSYHFDYSKMWTWNPAYWFKARIQRVVDGTPVSVVVLQKRPVSDAWPDERVAPIAIP